MVKLFLDANIYLDLYNSKSVNKLLPSLIQISEHILITDQVIAEIKRNQLKLAVELIKKEQDKFDLNSLPDTIIQNALDENETRSKEKLNNLNKQISKLKEEICEIHKIALQQVSTYKDKISTELSKAIYSKSLKWNNEDLERARKRKELGNPPGKKSDPIGDELSWEQILKYVKENKNEIWIVSRDGDYWTKIPGGSILLNPFLAEEIEACGSPTVKVFDNLSTALKEFDKRKIAAITLPSEEDMEKAKLVQKTKSTNVCCEKPTMHIIENGKFDIYICKNCNKQFGVYLADCD